MPAPSRSVPAIRSARLISALQSSALCRGPAAGAHAEDNRADGVSQRAARRPLGRRRVRRIATGNDGNELSRSGDPGEEECNSHDRYVADRRQFRKVPGRVESETVPEGERAQQQQGSGEAGRQKGEANQSTLLPSLWEP